MRQWAGRNLTYANVMVTILAFLVLGGGAAFAASHLAKNSVGTKQLKNNSVTSAKLKNDAVTSAKLKAGAVTGSKVADGSLTGKQVDSSSLGTVPVAERANSLAAPEKWHEVGTAGEPTFKSGWGNLPGATVVPETVAFYKDQQGFVHLRGGATNSAAVPQSAIFYLPPGYRPPPGRVLQMAVPCEECGSGVEAGTLEIFGPGTPSPETDAAVRLRFGKAASLDGITFSAGS